ncbi:hypothetical protein D9758_018059 [Tetrapyrgos nigripes]|uniref:Uncharacterized protein n=1 Tax=Tetrapyrgos nigripes TaxID=182062 RepID=A0A8H5BHE1_9AGAR|nr:hypothetical protein D9758_018059 [Tetrapyrgos nigripes]
MLKDDYGSIGEGFESSSQFEGVVVTGLVVASGLQYLLKTPSLYIYTISSAGLALLLGVPEV